MRARQLHGPVRLARPIVLDTPLIVRFAPRLRFETRASALVEGHAFRRRCLEPDTPRDIFRTRVYRTR